MQEGFLTQIGIDIGHGRLKVAGVQRRFGRASLVGVATVGIPQGVFTPTGLASTKELTEAIDLALREAHPHSLRSRDVVSALPASLVLTKLLELPPMSRTELAQTIPFEATQAFPVPAEELIIDWQALRKVSPDTEAGPTPPNQFQEVLMVGAPKNLVTALVELFDNLNLNLVGLEIKPLANVRATTHRSDRGTTLLVDIGGEDTSLVVVEGGEIRHISTLKFGANSLARQAIPTPEKTQPTKKVSKTIRKAASETAATPKPASLDFLAGQIEPLVDEINHVTKFAEQRLAGIGKVRRLRLCGGGANIPRLPTLLGRQTGLPTELANPLRHLRNSTNLTLDAALPLTTAIGLALREEYHD